MAQEYFLSVHDIVDILLRTGHLDTRIFNQSSRLEGTRLHQFHQSQQGDDYQSEVPLKDTFQYKDFIFHVSGKADGLITHSDGSYTIDEIKTTVADLDEFSKDHSGWHLGQARFYAYRFCHQNNIKLIEIQLTYIKQTDYHIQKRIVNTYSFSELDQFVKGIIFQYYEYLSKIRKRKIERDESRKDLSFPFRGFRPGQEKRIQYVKNSFDEGKQVFIEAPTGIGKTISVLFPRREKFKEGDAERCFYLTSKNSIKQVAMDSLNLFIKQGIKLKAIAFTSKDNICFNDKKGHCNPDECPFAVHYYDKLLDVVFDSLYRYDVFDRKTIEEIAYHHQRCPFQLQHDLANYMDFLICDYTYVYDFTDRLGLREENLPRKKTYLAVDECHNLPDRVRKRYSRELSYSFFAKRISFCSRKEFRVLKSDLKSCRKLLDAIPIDIDDENVKNHSLQVLQHLPEDILSSMNDILSDRKSLRKNHIHLLTDERMEFFYALNSFAFLAELRKSDGMENAFLCYVRVGDDGVAFSIRICNLDSSPLIKSGNNRFSACVFFSATLSPKDYYRELLGGDKNDTSSLLVLPSPFPKENRKIRIDSQISLYYKDRSRTIVNVYELIKTAINAKKGNYFIFCPSFEYLSKLQNRFAEDEDNDNTNLFCQSPGRDDNAQKDFLSHFKDQTEVSSIGLLVLGGSFNEGVDLVGNRLIGSIIISAGISKINFEQDRIKDYYDKDDGGASRKGYAYAYRYPGINRILQAAGRVIRSEEDRGFVLFIDSRFRQEPYRTIRKENYEDTIYLFSPSQLKRILSLFWKDE